WGALVAWSCALVRPDIFRGVAALSSPVQKRGPRPPIEQIRDLVGDRFNTLLYFQTPGVAEHELEHDVGATIRKTMVGLSGGNKYSPKPRPGGPPPKTAYLLDSMIDPGDDLPSWLSSKDLAVYVQTFQQTGFRGALNWYRNMDRNWEQGAAYQGKTIDQPALFMTGGRDFVPVDEAALRAIATDLRVFAFLEDIGHSTQEEAPTEVNQALLDFLQSL
ncbi:MAG: alpha/beta fold hydrolase, partial [Acidimicrobiales bacterium]